MNKQQKEEKYQETIKAVQRASDNISQEEFDKCCSLGSKGWTEYTSWGYLKHIPVLKNHGFDSCLKIIKKNGNYRLRVAEYLCGPGIIHYDRKVHINALPSSASDIQAAVAWIKEEAEKHDAKYKEEIEKLKKI